MTGSKKSATKRNRKPSFFYRGFGTFSDLESTTGHVGFDTQSVGGGFGMDTHISKNLTIGMAGGYSETRTNFNSTISNSNMQTGHVALFGGYTGEKWYVDSVLAYAYRDIEMERSTMTGLAESDHQANEISVYAGGGYNMIQDKNFLFGPVATLQFISIDEEAYSETGAGVANMSFADNTTDSLRTVLGVRMAQRLDLTESITIVPEVHLGWAHQWLDNAHSVTASFVGGGTGGVNIINRPLPDASANIGTALAVLLGEKTALTATYDADFGRSDFVTHIVNVDVDFHF
jgi:outer membrane autotransporter protein